MPRGASIRPVPFDIENPGPQPPLYLPPMPDTHAVLAAEIIAAAGRTSLPPGRLLGLCIAYVIAEDLPVTIHDDMDTARVVEQAREDYARWEATGLLVTGPTLDRYLQLTQQQAEADDDMAVMTRQRGEALARYRDDTGASFEDIARDLRGHGYRVTRGGVAWLIANYENAHPRTSKENDR